MKNLTIEEKENFDIKIYDLLSNLQKKIVSIRKKIKLDKLQLSLLYDELNILKYEYEQILASYNGQGKYKDVARKPSIIKEKIEYTMRYNDYNSKINEEKEKIAKLELPKLEIELKQAEIELENLRKRELEVKEQYIMVKNNYKKKKKELKIHKDEYQNLKYKQQLTLKRIRMIDYKYSTGKRIPKRLLIINSSNKNETK